MSVPKFPNNVILFYRENDVHYEGEKNYYGFTNFSPHKVITKGLPRLLTSDGKVDESKGYIMPDTTFEWKTSEHLFNAMKFTQEGKVDEKLIKEVYNQNEPMAAKNFAGKKNGCYNVANWWYNDNFKNKGYNYAVMKWVVREKLRQNEDVKKLLTSTGQQLLVENSGVDRDKWGNGQEGNHNNLAGRNWLGEILMAIRSELVQNNPSKNNNSNSNIPSQPTSPPSGGNKPNTPNQPTPGNNNSPPNSPSPNSNAPSNNEPTDNSNNNPDSAPPNNKQENDDNSNKSDIELPILDTKKITNSKNIETAQFNAKQQIQVLFAKSKIKPSDLDKSLWDNQENWESFLAGLKTNQKILEFVQLLEGKIKEKQHAIKNQDKANSSSKSNFSNKVLILSLGGGVSSLIFIALIVIKIKFKRKNKKLEFK